jgi:hypothetical protein
MEVGELPHAYLVGDLSRLRIAPVIHLLSLVQSQLLESAKRQQWIDHRALQTHDQAVSAKQGNEPRHSGRRQPNLGRKVILVQPQRAEVFHRLLEDSRHLGIGRA